MTTKFLSITLLALVLATITHTPYINSTMLTQSQTYSKKELIKYLAHINAINLSGVPHHDGTILPIYFDLRLLISYPQLLQQFAHHLNAMVQQCTFDIVCGVPQAAIPLATSLAVTGDYPMILQRKEVKSYGTKKYIEGVYKSGNICAVIEDVIVSGYSILESIKILESQGLVVKDIFVLIDREQGGMENIKRHGYNIKALFTMSEILDILLEEKVITLEQFTNIKKFCSESRTIL